MNRSLLGRAAVGIGLLVASLSSAAPHAYAQGAVRPVEALIVNPPGQPVPVTAPVPIAVTAPAPLPVSIVSNRQSFTFPPVAGTLTTQGPNAPADPSGTQYAITSVTVTNTSTSPQTLTMRAVAGEVAAGSGCRLPFNVVQTAPGPVVVVPATGTVHLSFPEPFVTAAVTGTAVCLAAHADPATINLTWSAVGYRIVP